MSLRNFTRPAGSLSNERLPVRRTNISSFCAQFARWQFLRRTAGLACCFLLVLALAGLAAGQGPAGRLQPQHSPITIESSPQLFAVMCSLIAAGYDPGPSSATATQELAQLRTELERSEGPATDAVRQFYRDHQLADPGETLSRYISLALVVGPPPQFNYVLSHDLLPPDVLAIEDFQGLLAKFYAEAGLERRWANLAPEYNRESDRLQGPVRQMVLMSTAYLREVFKPEGGRSFSVFVEPLAGNQINFRNFGDHYAVVIGNTSQPPLDNIRHALLHFLLDPLPLRYRPIVESKQGLLEIAGRAPRLAVVYQQDFVAFFTECLIRAVELRLRRIAPAELDAALADADSSGYILERPLVQQLQIFEKAEPAMHYYFPDLVRGIDVAAERKRLQGVQFAAADAPEKAEDPRDEQMAELNRWLGQGDRQIAVQDAPGAAATFEAILQKYPNLPRALYGLALASVLQGDGARAKELFEKLVAGPTGRQSPAMTEDPRILAWSHVYLGRIHDMQGDRELAVKEYSAAMAVKGAPDTARSAAQKGVAAAYQPAMKNPNTEPQKP